MLVSWFGIHSVIQSMIKGSRQWESRGSGLCQSVPIWPGPRRSRFVSLSILLSSLILRISVSAPVIRAGHKVRWSVEALKSVAALSNVTTLIYHSNKLNLTVQRLILKKIVLSALKFVFFESTLTEQRLFFFLTPESNGTTLYNLFKHSTAVPPVLASVRQWKGMEGEKRNGKSSGKMPARFGRGWWW